MWIHRRFGDGSRFVGCHVSIVRIHVSIPFQFDTVLVDDDLIGSGFGGQVLHPIKATSDFVIPKIDLRCCLAQARAR